MVDEEHAGSTVSPFNIFEPANELTPRVIDKGVIGEHCPRNIFNSTAPVNQVLFTDRRELMVHSHVYLLSRELFLLPIS
jgi:hypothetical protein